MRQTFVIRIFSVALINGFVIEFPFILRGLEAVVYIKGFGMRESRKVKDDKLNYY